MLLTCTVNTTNAEVGQWLYTVPVELVTNHGLTAHIERSADVEHVGPEVNPLCSPAQ